MSQTTVAVGSDPILVDVRCLWNWLAIHFHVVHDHPVAPLTLACRFYHRNRSGIHYPVAVAQLDPASGQVIDLHGR